MPIPDFFVLGKTVNPSPAPPPSGGRFGWRRLWRRRGKEKTPLTDYFNFFKLITAAIIFLLLLTLIFSWIQGQKNWRAVFLTNNQVYFGHFLWLPLVRSVRLNDIYYLQVTEPLQQQTNNRSPGQPEIKIVKFGNEIHGPTDQMVIMKNQIIFWENLRDDSPVVKAIGEDKNK